MWVDEKGRDGGSDAETVERLREEIKYEKEVRGWKTAAGRQKGGRRCTVCGNERGIKGGRELKWEGRKMRDESLGG